MVPTGVTLKPSNNHMKEFIKRLKSLKKDLVFQILIDKIKNYENMADTTSIKTLTVNIFFIIIKIIKIILEMFIRFRVYFK